MKATFRVASQFRQPLIKFLGKRKLPSEPDVPHPHPQAPPEFRKTFGHNASGSSVAAASTIEDGAPQVYTQFWEAPSRYWNHRVRELEKHEIDSIMSGGASTA